MSSLLVALPSYIASTTNFINAIVTCALGYGVAFAAAYVIGFEDIVDAEQQPVVTIDKSLVKEMNIASPVRGTISDLQDVNDSAFSSLPFRVKAKSYRQYPAQSVPFSQQSMQLG